MQEGTALTRPVSVTQEDNLSVNEVHEHTVDIMRKRHKIFADVYDVLIFFVITDYEAEHRGSRQALPSAQKERE